MGRASVSLAAPTTRRRALALLAGSIVAPFVPTRARAADIEVPIPLQVDLMARVVKYDRNAEARMAGTCRVLIVRRANEKGSVSASIEARTELQALEEVAGATVATRMHDFADTAGFARDCGEYTPGLVVLASGLSDVAGSLAAALADRDVLSVSLMPEDVYAGIVLGFTLESSRPTIVVNLPHARRQHVDFSARLLAIARVVE
jgi:hypothetical protein